MTAGEYFSRQADAKTARRSPARDEAKAWLLDTLKNGPVAADVVFDMASQGGFSDRTINRVKKQLGIMSERRGFGGHGKSYWRLPDSNNDHENSHGTLSLLCVGNV
jgi:hypothetical protein